MALDADIWEAVFPDNFKRLFWARKGVLPRDTPDDQIRSLLSPPPYTSSLDIAMKLVPKRWSKDIWLKRHGGHHWACDLHVPSSERRGRHVHAPIAVCIAALTAIASDVIKTSD